MPKPTLSRFMSKWVCQTAHGDNIGFDRHQQLYSTQADTAEAAWANWYESIRVTWAWSAGATFQLRTHFRGGCHRRVLLAEKCATLVGHDRYLVKVDSK